VLLLALMVLGSIGGMTATYLITGKLILNPHLIAGLSMTGLIAISASLAPLMRGGVKWARPLHLTLNLVLVGLFISQAATGIQLVQKLLNPPSETAATEQPPPSSIEPMLSNSGTISP
jgi:hypothetical protein